ncbi:uncharacterized protein LOC141906303 [Tubulanus polymorphus]|uniref:uncharacterized protein LOC141906303 n=1 Tax=Tubulanus polymorphus TaxID=672921 RepID=UPI003DA5AADA
MPRKKRERLDISSTGVKSSAWPNSSTTTTTTVDVVGPLDRDRIFQQVKEMFHGQIDPEVIQIVLSEYNWQVENTLDALFNMTGEQPSRITEPSLDDDRISLKSIASNFYKSSPINASSTMTNSVSAILPGQNDDISSLVGNEQNFGCGYIDSYYFENDEFDLDYTALMSTDQQQTEVIQSVGNGSSAAPKSNAAEIQRPINESPGEEYTQSLQYEDDSGAFPLRDSLSSNQPSSGKEDCLNLGARKNVVRGKKSAPIAEKSAKITYNPLIMTEQSSSKSSPLNSSLDGLKNPSHLLMTLEMF